MNNSNIDMLVDAGIGGGEEEEEEVILEKKMTKKNQTKEVEKENDFCEHLLHSITKYAACQ